MSNQAAATTAKKRKVISIALRSPVPSGPSDARVGIERRDGGWYFRDPETGEMYWTPDSNVISLNWKAE